MKSRKARMPVRFDRIARSLGVSQKTLAEIMRVSPSTVRSWASGEHRPLRAHRECRIAPLYALVDELKALLGTKEDVKEFLNARCEKAHRTPLQMLKRNRYTFEKPGTVDLKLNWVFESKTRCSLDD